MKKIVKKPKKQKKLNKGGRFFVMFFLFGGLILTVAALLSPQYIRQFAQYSAPPLFGCLHTGEADQTNCGTRMGDTGKVSFSLYGRPVQGDNPLVYYNDTFSGSYDYSNTGDQPIAVKSMGIAAGALSQYYIADFDPLQGPTTIQPKQSVTIKTASYQFGDPDPNGNWVIGAGLTDTSGQHLPVETSTTVKVVAACTALRVKPLTSQDKSDVQALCKSDPNNALCASKQYCQIFKGGNCPQEDVSPDVSGQQCDDAIVLAKSEQDMLEQLCKTYPDADACQDFCDRSIGSAICPQVMVDDAGDPIAEGGTSEMVSSENLGPKAVAGATIGINETAFHAAAASSTHPACFVAGSGGSDTCSLGINYGTCQGFTPPQYDMAPAHIDPTHPQGWQTGSCSGAPPPPPPAATKPAPAPAPAPVIAKPGPAAPAPVKPAPVVTTTPVPSKPNPPSTVNTTKSSAPSGSGGNGTGSSGTQGGGSGNTAGKSISGNSASGTSGNGKTQPIKNPGKVLTIATAKKNGTNQPCALHTKIKGKKCVKTGGKGKTGTAIGKLKGAVKNNTTGNGLAGNLLLKSIFTGISALKAPVIPPSYNVPVPPSYNVPAPVVPGKIGIGSPVSNNSQCSTANLSYDPATSTCAPAVGSSVGVGTWVHDSSFCSKATPPLDFDPTSNTCIAKSGTGTATTGSTLPASAGQSTLPAK
ncbi:MAG: hypothetical protein ACR2LN_04385 [Candidatus Levyibacteriota bacterium]